MKQEKDNIISINGKKIDAKGYFNTLEKVGNKEVSRLYARIEILNYSELGYMLNSLLSVTRQALESEISEVADKLDLSRVLEIATNLIPFAELELLSEIHAKLNHDAPE